MKARKTWVAMRPFVQALRGLAVTVAVAVAVLTGPPS